MIYVYAHLMHMMGNIVFTNDARKEQLYTDDKKDRFQNYEKEYFKYN